ncbi:hypothetical protein [Deinococcus ruber]|uniref:Uncharacterized protein n=1 Tax=Deinococcus ruber TaxID=1848197 RepID=A0A918C1E8_9DEIO|nr:hypothetical protein [Deinococcus ruber]GGR00169.1 hypothetical protein GCM10008957_11120 [Deinococcus ruber]
MKQTKVGKTLNARVNNHRALNPLYNEPEPYMAPGRASLTTAELNDMDAVLVFQRGSKTILGLPGMNLRSLFTSRKHYRLSMEAVPRQVREAFERHQSHEYASVQFKRQSFDVVAVTTVGMTPEYYEQSFQGKEHLIEVGQIMVGKLAFPNAAVRERELS